MVKKIAVNTIPVSVVKLHKNLKIYYLIKDHISKIRTMASEISTLRIKKNQ